MVNLTACTMRKEERLLDAGLRSLDHYQTRLPRWRYRPRERLLPIVRWETPYLAWLQAKLRSPALDSYFAVTANLGTHTFFMIVLPILFWCGYTSLGRGMVHILASGVIVSGFIKDFWCLPRPLSPPLQRITMSGSAALEYGFPSTHSTNAVSVAVYVLYLLHGDSTLSAPAKMGWQVIFYFYAFSIVLGRLYCGMHGFFDVVVGSVLGAAISLVQCAYGEAFDLFIHQASGKDMLIIVLAILVLVRIHPEPADDCPCFDDSVAFAGVVIGIEYGSWHFSDTQYAWSQPTPGTVPFDLASMGWTVTIARIVMGVMVIFAWRGSMKPVLFRTLPPIFRVIERLGLSLPRKFFKQASQYTRIPQPGPDDNVIPALSQIPSFLTWMRHPRRRSISIGPQSEADAYETLAYRQKRRRNSLSAGDGSRRRALSRIVSDDGEARPHSPRTDVSNGTISPAGGRMSQLERYERLMGTGFEPARPAEAGPVATSAVQAEKVEFPDAKREEEEMFSRILKPRVRYDVEVITKLIIYSGIAWLAVEGNPILFEVFGLGS